MSDMAAEAASSSSPPPPPQGVLYKTPTAALSGRALSKWRRIDPWGESSALQADKHAVSQRCAVPLRDLRLLDADLTTSFSTALLARERAILVNLEHVKLIVTPDEVLVPNAELYESCAFADFLAARLRQQDGGTSGTSSGSGVTAPGVRYQRLNAQHAAGGLPSVPEGGGAGLARPPSLGANLDSLATPGHTAVGPRALNTDADGSSPDGVPRFRLARWLSYRLSGRRRDGTAHWVQTPHVRFGGSRDGSPTSSKDSSAPGVSHSDVAANTGLLKDGPATLASSSTSPQLLPGWFHPSSAGLQAASKEPKPWLRLDSRGRSSTILADKHSVAARYGVPLRDLRLLDSGLTTSFSAALLCRKRTIVINLEHVKMLVTHTDVLLPPTASVECASFVAELRRRLMQRHKAVEREAAEQHHSDDVGLYSGSRKGGQAAAILLAGGTQPDGTSGDGVSPPQAPGGGGLGDSGVLPFELCVLDCALEAACSALEQATSLLERETPTALDALGESIDAATLERVRKLKAMIARDEGRAAAVRGEILSLLDDDSDMRACLLTRKAALRAAKQVAARGNSSGLASPFPLGGGHAGAGESYNFASGMGTAAGTRIVSNVSTPGAGFMSPVAPPTALAQMQRPSAVGAGRTWSVMPMAPFTPRGMHTPLGQRLASGGLAALAETGEQGATQWVPSSPQVASTLALALAATLADDADVQAVEDILETYFAQVDRTCARLGALDEHVGQTEQFVNIDLDSKRNTLIEMMLLTAFMLFANSFYTTITGMFAMMLPNFTSQGWQHVWNRFIALNVTCSGLVIAMAVVFVYLMRKNRIVQL
jgi:hypothetical protein